MAGTSGWAKPRSVFARPRSRPLFGRRWSAGVLALVGVAFLGFALLYVSSPYTADGRVAVPVGRSPRQFSGDVLDCDPAVLTSGDDAAAEPLDPSSTTARCAEARDDIVRRAQVIAALGAALLVVALLLVITDRPGDRPGPRPRRWGPIDVSGREQGTGELPA